jgi:translation initiation factor 2A
MQPFSHRSALVRAPQQPVPSAAAPSGANNGGSANGSASSQAAAQAQDPNANKVRSLQKKIRAIEELEMLLAGGEKLEDAQLKKINTKSSVI